MSAGVGYAKATRMVDHYGTNMLAIMDSPDCVQQLSKVPTIGHTLAVNFKKHWDASRGIITAANSYTELSYTDVSTFKRPATPGSCESLLDNFLGPSYPFNMQVKGRVAILRAALAELHS